MLFTYKGIFLMIWKGITLSKKQLTILLNVGAMSLHGQSQIVQRSFTLNHNNNIWVFLWLELLCSLHNTKDIQIFSYSDLTLQYSKQILNLYGLRGCMKYCRSELSNCPVHCGILSLKLLEPIWSRNVTYLLVLQRSNKSLTQLMEWGKHFCVSCHIST